MRKLIFILFLFPLILFSQTTYYVSTTGNNGNPGTIELPWRNIWYACSHVTSGNNINIMSGTYSEGTQWTWASGVSIYGISGVRVESSLATADQPLVKAETSSGWLYPSTVGHQEINGITFDGNNITHDAIHINFRHYVKIINCNFIDFQYNAITFYGMDMGLWTLTSVFEPDRTMPNYFCVGNEISNCTFTNCTQGTRDGQINIGQQDGVKIFDNDIYQPIKGSGGNCGGIKFKGDGYNKNTDMHDNIIIVDLNGGNSFNFSIEMWYELGGCKYYDNVFQGGTDFDAAVKGSSTYSIWFHNNEVGYPTHQRSNHYAINLEASCSDVIIEKNYIHHVRAGIYVSQIWPILEGSGRNRHPYTNELNNIRISCNLFVDIGRLAGGGDWEPVYGIYFGRSSKIIDITTLDNIYVDNNVIECTAVTPYSYYVTGIWLPNANTVVNNLRIRNNIIIGFAGGTNFSAPIFGTGLYGSNDINDLYIQKNLCYGNGNSNNTLLVSGYAPDPYTYDTHIKLDPLFETDYRLQQGSPAIRVGMWVNLLKDFKENDYYNPPSLGVYEYVSESPPTGTDYYVKNGGSDAAAGTSDATAWATVAKVNAATYIEGDRVFFKRGSTWREQLVPKSGTADAYMYYGAYGTGAKPLFLGSKEENSTDDWTEEYPNIWQSNDAAFTVDVGNIIFNGEASCGVKSMNISPTLDAQGKFWYSHANNWLWIYSTLNPATYYTDIECALMKDALYSMSGKQYITFQNLDFRYWGACVWSYGGNYLNFYDIDISYIGGADQNSDYSTRYGNGLQMWQGIRNITIERCRISNVYDAGISPQGYSGTYTAQNLIIRNNIINKCEYGFEFYFRPVTTATCQNVYFEHNTVTNSGGGWGHSQRPDGVSGQAVRIYNFTATKSNIYIRNNIFYGATERLFSIGSLSDLTNIVLDYNCYYTATGYVGRIGSTNYSSLATWQGAISQEVNAIGEDPLFVSPIDFHLRSTSPVIGGGVAVSGVALDFDLESYLNPPSIGAYEYTGGVEPEPEPGIRRVIKHNGKIIKNNGKIVKN